MGATFRDSAIFSGTGSEYTFELPPLATPADAVFAIVVHNNGLSHAPAQDSPPIPSGFPAPGWTTWNSFTTGGGGTVRILEKQSIVVSGLGPWVGKLTGSGPWVVGVFAVQKDPQGVKAKIMGMQVATASAVLSVIAPGITPEGNDDLIVDVIALGRGSSITPPPEVIERIDGRSGDENFDKSLAITTRSLVGSSAIPASTYTFDNQFDHAPMNATAIRLDVRSGPPSSSWTGDFETGDTSQWSGLHYDPNPASGEMEIRTSSLEYPARQGTYFCRLATTDFSGLNITDNPRTELTSPTLIYPGYIRWLAWAVRFHNEFPKVPEHERIMYMEPYGPPYDHSPPFAHRITGESTQLRIAGNHSETENPKNTDVWDRPLERGKWFDVVMLVKFMKDSTGWFKLWFTPEDSPIPLPQTFVDGSRQYFCQTFDNNMEEGMRLYLNNYRNMGVFGATPTIIDFDALPDRPDGSKVNMVDVVPPSDLYLQDPPVQGRSINGHTALRLV